MTTQEGVAVHMRGPWLLKHGVVENRNIRWVELTDYRLVAKLPDTLTHPDSMFDEARVAAWANLIAAAPDLLAALEVLLSELEWVNEQLDLMPDDYAEAQTNAAAAIARARGEQP